MASAVREMEYQTNSKPRENRRQGGTTYSAGRAGGSPGFGPGEVSVEHLLKSCFASATTAS